MKLTILFFCVLFFQNEIHYKADDEFKANIELKFKSKSVNQSNNSYDVSGNSITKNLGEVAAFVSVTISDLKILPDEIKIKAVDNEGKVLLNKKTSPLPQLRFDFGFIDELKKNELNEITIYFLSDKKKELRRIVITILSDGEFLVNGKWHGKL